jgi:positive regulator of sigma E activity
MIEEEAVVSLVEPGRVWIEKAKQSGCSGCAQACPSALSEQFFSAKPMRFPIATELPLQVGDPVLVGMPETALTHFALVFYLTPLAAFFLGAVLGQALTQHELFAFLGGLLGLGLGLAGLKLSKRLERSESAPIILRKLD